MGGLPRALVLLDTSKSCRFSWSWLLPRLLTQAAPHTMASATSTLMLSRSRKMIVNWDLCGRKEFMLS